MYIIYILYLYRSNFCTEGLYKICGVVRSLTSLIIHNKYDR